ncbi:MAG: beta-ketoacyl-[acyl-carrier-protein] synthase family protein [Candidatus Omnitrophota bacterium]|nr:beta-ketoacyl-[acyl-carrier-protein] synthase family protein [Candidatus Omnitrophota bacterium]
MKKNKFDTRVVVTGLGVVSSLGIGWQLFWKNLLAGKSGISRITLFDTSKYDRHYGGEVKNFDSNQFMDKRRARTIGRASQMAIAATKLALKDAKLDLKSIKNKNTTVCVGTTMGEPQIMEELDEKYYPKNKKIKVDFHSALRYPSNTISMNISTFLKVRGKSIMFSTACSSGNYAVAYAYDAIKTRKCDMALAGGVDALSRIAFTGFGRIFAMAPEKCQPFDKNRQGMIVGEGAGMLILESLESARKRKAKIYAEILGYGMSCDAYHMTDPSVEGIKKVIKKALGNSHIKSDDIDYISAHGTGTKENDQAECQALHQVFKGRADKIPISSIKSMLGHTMGAASAFESIACCLAIKFGIIPPTINFTQRDPMCDIYCVPDKSIRKKLKIVLNNSQAFGGNNACIVLKKF